MVSAFPGKVDTGFPKGNATSVVCDQQSEAVNQISSQIDDDIAVGLGAADQYIAVRGCIDRIGPVADRPHHKSGLTGVADPRSTRPSHSYVARFGQLEQAPERRPPANIEAAPGE
jgi:hypothetical protein